MLFTLVPLIELALLIEIGSYIGTTNTILLVVATGIAGAILAKAQGFQVFTRIQAELNAGHLPGDSLIDGAMVLAGGILLLTPGIITDFVGLAALFPLTRDLLKRLIREVIKKKASRSHPGADYKIDR
jgi:UPF0716 protein FxsA